MESKTMTFVETDGLMLVAVSSVKEVHIEKWLGMIDFYHRIILSFEEMNDALVRLQKHGFITYENGEFIIRPDVQKQLLRQGRMLAVSEWIIKQSYCDSFEVKYVLSETAYKNSLHSYKKCYASRKEK